MPTIKTLLIDLPEYSGFFHLLVKSVDAQAGRNDSRVAKHISQRFIRGLSQVVKINLCSDPAPEWRAPTAQSTLVPRRVEITIRACDLAVDARERHTIAPSARS